MTLLLDLSFEVPVSLNQEVLLESFSVKMLGVKFDNDLCFTSHVDDIILKLRQTFYFIRKVKPFINEKTCCTLYYAYVLSRIDYCIIVWSTGKKDDFLRVNSLVNSIKRFLDCDKLFNDIFHHLFVRRCLFAHKILFNSNSNVPGFLVDLCLDAISPVHDLSTRNNGYLFRLPVKYRERLLGRSPLLKCFNVFNLLPLDTRTEQNVYKFKCKVSNFISQKDHNFCESSY